MHPLPLSEVATCIGARGIKQITPWQLVTHITQDSRTIQSGSLFFALPGKRVDGHNFLWDAKAKGAVAAVVEHRREDLDFPQLLVPSTSHAFGDLARSYRMRFDIPVVAITGSVGKTSTKELAAHVLSASYRTHKSRKNFNNQLGVPIELFQLDDIHQVSVVELAMRGLREIEYLARIVRPTIGVITNIGISHIERLGSQDSIAEAKAELLAGLDSEGIIVVNRDDKYYDFLRSKASCRVLTFGKSKDADFRLSDLRYGTNGQTSFTVNGVPVSFEYAMGEHHAINAASIFAVGTILKIPYEDISERMHSFRTPEQRGEFTRAKCGAILLNSTYNAAPDSIKASLGLLRVIQSKGIRAVAVLGSILELGPHSEAAHRYVGKLVADSSVDLLVTVGEHARFIGDEAKISHWEHFQDADAAAKFLLNETKADDCLVVQGSRGMQLETVIQVLEQGRQFPLPDSKTSLSSSDEENSI